MQIENHTLKSFTMDYPLERTAPLDKFLFISKPQGSPQKAPPYT